MQAGSTPRQAPGWRLPRAMGPPGIVFWLAVVVAVLFGFDTNSRRSLGGLVLTVPIWYAVAGWWIARFGWWALAGGAGRERFRVWVGWFGVPLVMGLVYLGAQLNVPFDVRLWASRGAMDAAAREVMAGGSTDRSTIGWYPAERVERTPTGMRFVIDGDFSTVGFEYSSTNHPGVPDTVDLDSYEPLGDGWYLWYETFG